jgi:hypothetical protein
LGNLSKIRTVSQLETLTDQIDQHFGDSYDKWGHMTGLSEKRELFECARYIFNSEAYLLLHRAARYILTKYILTIMLDLACPLGFTPLYDDENFDPFEGKELDAKEYFKLLKGFINGDNNDI